MSISMPPPHEVLTTEPPGLINDVWYRWLKESAGGGASAGGVRILQVVTTNTNADITTSSTSFVANSSNSITITPTSTASRVLVRCFPMCDNSAGGNILAIKWSRGVTNDTNMIGNEARFYSAVNAYGGTPIEALDSPATTSAQSYGIQLKSYVGTVKMYGATISVPMYAFELSTT